VDPSGIIDNIDTIGTMEHAITASKLSELRDQLCSRSTGQASGPADEGGPSQRAPPKNTGASHSQSAGTGHSHGAGAGHSQGEGVGPARARLSPSGSAGRGGAGQPVSVGVVELTGGASGEPTPQSAGVASSRRGKELVVYADVPAPAADDPATMALVLRPRMERGEKAIVIHGGAKKDEKKKGKGKADEDKEKTLEVAEFFSDEYYQCHVDSGYVFGKDARFRVSLASLEVSSLYFPCHCICRLFPPALL
jgi:hypothetical protein